MRKGVKVTALLLGAVLLLGLAACGKKNVQNPQTTAAGSENTAETTAVLKQQIKVAALKGPTAIGMVQLMENAKEQTAKNDYEFQRFLLRGKTKVKLEILLLCMGYNLNKLHAKIQKGRTRTYLFEVQSA